MKKTIELDGVDYSLSFEELVQVSQGGFHAIDPGNHDDPFMVMEEAREIVINDFSSCKQLWNEIQEGDIPF